MCKLRNNLQSVHFFLSFAIHNVKHIKVKSM